MHNVCHQQSGHTTACNIQLSCRKIKSKKNGCHETDQLVKKKKKIKNITEGREAMAYSQCYPTVSS